MISRIIKDEYPTENDSKEEWLLAERAAFRALELIYVEGIDEHIHIPGIEFEPGTGALDMWGWRIRPDKIEELAVIDFKSGDDQREYLPQLAAYALAKMLDEQLESCGAYIIGIDSGDVWEHVFTEDEARETVCEIVYGAGKGDPIENEYCNWCDNRSVCPVFVRPSEAVVAVVDTDLASQFAAGLDAIKESPELLGKFLVALDKFDGIIEAAGLQDKAKEYLANNIAVPGLKLIKRNGREFFTPEQNKQILRTWKGTPDELAAIISVNVKAYREAPEECKESAVIPNRGEPSVALTINKPATSRKVKKVTTQ